MSKNTKCIRVLIKKRCRLSLAKGRPHLSFILLDGAFDLMCATAVYQLNDT